MQGNERVLPDWSWGGSILFKYVTLRDNNNARGDTKETGGD